MPTILLLIVSYTFMTFAWYGHLKHKSALLGTFGEHCFQVLANRLGDGVFSAFQLKIIQECITLIVFAVFASLYLGERMRWNYAMSLVCILTAVVFLFWGKE